MSKETGNPSFAFHHAWLEVAEEKLMTAFEDLHGVCFGIIEECLKTSWSNHADVCCNCKDIDTSNGLELSKERQRYSTRFSSTVENWKDKFKKLKKKYRQLKRSSNAVEGAKNLKNNHKHKLNKVTRVNIDTSSENEEENQKTEVKNKDKNTKTLSEADFLYGGIANKHDHTKPKIHCEKSVTESRLQRNETNSQDKILPKEICKPVDSGLTELISEEELDKLSTVEDETRSGSEEHTNPSWKSANRAPLRGKHSAKIKYLDNGRKLSTNKSIHEFFKPHSVSQICSITSRRSKRQIKDSSVELPRKKRQKEEKSGSESEIETSLKLKESIIDVENSDVSRNDTKGSELEGGRELIETDGDETRYEAGSVKIDNYKSKIIQSLNIHGDTTETVSIADTQDMIPMPVNSSQVFHDYEKERQNPGDRKASDGDLDVTCWGLDDKVGLPALASTPMVHMENVAKSYQNCRDYDDTMWSAPESPSVVRSIFSTPEKISDDVKSPENDKEEDQERHFKVPRKDAIPLFLKESQSYLTELSRDSNHRSRRENVMWKTSEADLSGDMFFGNTQNIENTQEECSSPKERPYEIENDGEIERNFKEKAVGMTSFKRQKPDVKYKFNAVVRKRDERDKLDGYACAECAAWYQDEEDCEEKRKHLRNVCRHKAVSSPPPSTPEGFWSIGFPDTPVYMKKGLMLDEEDTLPLHARPKKRKGRTDKNKERKENNKEE